MLCRIVPLLSLVFGAAMMGSADPAIAQAERQLVDHPGLIRNVTLGRAEVAWSHCRLAAGPTRAWTSPLRRPAPRPIRRQATAGVCAPDELVGVWGPNVVLKRSRLEGGTELVAIRRATGAVTVIDEDGPAGRIIAADANGPRLVWLRETGSGATGYSQALLTHIGTLSAPRVLYTRTLLRDAVRPVDVWAGPGGQAVVREVLAGAIFGYALGSERAVLVNARDDSVRRVAQLSSGNRVVSADLSGKYWVYTVARDGDRRVRVIAYTIETGKRRRIRLARLLPAGMAPQPPAVPVPAISGDQVAWRERVAQRRGFRDRIALVDLEARRSRTVTFTTDRRWHRTFISQPSLRGNRLVYATTRFVRPVTATGGFLGRTEVPARSRVIEVRLR